MSPLARTDKTGALPLEAPRELLAQQAAHFSGDAITRYLLDAMPGAVFVLNRYRQVIFVNRTVLDLIGADCPEGVIGKRPGDVMDCLGSHVAEHGCGTGEHCQTCGALMAIMASVDGEHDVRECLMTRRAEDGVEHLTLRVWTTPITFDDDQFTVLAGMDVSHERRRQTLERTFFHDILNLVGSIRGFAELMELDDTLDPGIIGRRIQMASQRVIDEIDAQRMLLAAEKGALETNLQLLDIHDILKDLVELYSLQEITRDCTVRIAEQCENLSFIGDAAILVRILGNMLKNALEASQPGETVTLGAVQERAHVTVWVHNPGHISEKLQPRVFQRDFSTKGRGRGLGTYSMKMLARLIDGEVSFTSVPETGTRFEIRIPCGVK